jgi:hypothetical protein
MLSLHLTLLHHVRRLLLQLEAPLAAFIIAAAVLVTGIVLINGPKMRAASEATIKADIEQEDRAVCAKFGFASGSGFFACSDALARVRQQQEERMAGYSFW